MDYRAAFGQQLFQQAVITHVADVGSGIEFYFR
jgi:hypothetical protein